MDKFCDISREEQEARVIKALHSAKRLTVRNIARLVWPGFCYDSQYSYIRNTLKRLERRGKVEKAGQKVRGWFVQNFWKER